MRSACALIAAFALVVTACSGDASIVTEPGTVGSVVSGTVAGETTITFWSTETQANRLQITEGVTEAFTAKTGIGVELISIEENALAGIMAANAAAGTLPDVVYHPVDYTIEWAAAGLLDLQAAQETVDVLGADTFSRAALELATYRGSVAAVPSDGWGQLLIYRKDLFDSAGLEAPDTFAKLEAAAAALTDPTNDFYGITASTDANVALTQQTFEHFALANGCELVGNDGTVTLNSSNCVEAIEFYTDLLADYGPPAAEGVVETRSRYFAGKAAMIVWSPFILDEMAGLRDAALPGCDECASDVAFLARNSGVVQALRGPSGGPAQYGQVSNLGIGTGANTEAAKRFVEFWLSDGYLDWLGASAEGKLPMRRGTTSNPTLFIEGWRMLETGVDRKAPLRDFYGDELLTTLVEGLDSFDRWGIPQGQGTLVESVYSSLPIGRVIRTVLDGNATAAEGAADMQALVEEEQALLE